MTQAIEPVDDVADRAIEPVNGRNLPDGFPKWVRDRALLLCETTGSVAAAQRQLAAEMVDSGLPAPSYKGMWIWARQYKDVISLLSKDRKEEMVATATDVAAEAAGCFLEALPKLSPSQMPVAYGIAMQRRTDWESAGNKGNQLNVQFNLVSHDGKPIKQGDGGS